MMIMQESLFITRSRATAARRRRAAARKHFENAGRERRQGELLLAPEMDFKTAIIATGGPDRLRRARVPDAAAKAAAVNPILPCKTNNKQASRK
jgi:hypothetical protein